MYFLREEKSREVKGGARVSEWQAKYSLIRFAFTRTSLGRAYKSQSGLGHRPPSSETCNSRSFGRTRFEYWQQPGNFQRLPQVWAEIAKLEASAFGFRLTMHFDECTEARAINIIDLLQINDNPRGVGCEEIVDRCTQPAALFSEHKTPFERQKVDSIHFTLCYFQRHSLPPQVITQIRECIHNSLRIRDCQRLFNDSRFPEMETDCPREKLVRPFLNHESARIYRCSNHIRGGRRRGDENRPSLPDDAGAHSAVRIRNRAACDVWRSPQSCAHRICKRDRDLSRVIVHRISSRQLRVLSTCAGAGRSGRRNIDTQWCSDCLLLEIGRRQTPGLCWTYCTPTYRSIHIARETLIEHQVVESQDVLFVALQVG